MAQTEKDLGEPGQGRRMVTNDFQKWQNRIPPKKERKGKEEDARNGDAEKGIPQHVPKRMANQKLSKESEPREGKNERKRKRDLPRRWGQNMLCLQKNKTGEPTVPRDAQKTPL